MKIKMLLKMSWDVLLYCAVLDIIIKGLLNMNSLFEVHNLVILFFAWWFSELFIDISKKKYTLNI